MSVDKLDRQGWLTLLTIGFGVSVVIMDATIVNVALPVVMKDLGLDGSDAQWLNASYALVFAALLVTVGRIGDLRGRRRMFLAGNLVFMAASVVAGLAQSAGPLIGARVIQGLGAAMIVPSTLSILNATFTGRARTIAFAVWGSAIGGMAAIGPLVGGWLATDVSWRWAFWLNIPVGLLVLLGIWRAVPESQDPRGAAGSPDPVGAILSALGMGSVVFGLIEGSWFGWWRQPSGALSPVPVALFVGIGLLIAFVRYELLRARSGRTTLVDPALFRLRSFSAGIAALVIVAAGELGLLFTLPLLLQGTLGYSALGTGTVILALALGTFTVSGLIPRLERSISQHTTVRLGLFLEAAALAGLAILLRPDVSRWELLLLLFVYGCGVGFATAQLTSLLLTDVPTEQSGQASGIQSSLRQLGAALGVAILGGLLVGSLASTTKSNLEAANLPARQVDQITQVVKDSAGIAISGLQRSPDQRLAARAAGDAMVHASRVTTGVASGVLLLGLAATMLIPARPNRDSGQLRNPPTAPASASS